MEYSKNKNLWLGGVALVFLSVFVIWPMIASRPLPALDQGGEDDIALVPQVSTDDMKNSAEDTSEGSVNKNAGAVSISYAEALVKYKDTRIQLNNLCQATPNNVTFKNGTDIMIDNRSPVARSVKVGSSFSIKAYGFKIVKLSSPATLPTTWLVDCDAAQNVATILIQK